MRSPWEVRNVDRPPPSARLGAMRWKATLGMVALGTGLLLGPGVAAADADSLTDSLGPRALGVGEALRASANGASSTTLNPAGAGLIRSYVVEGSYGFRGTDDATAAAVAVCDSVTSRVAACVYYHYFSAEPDAGERSLHETGLTLALPIADRLFIGATTKYVDYTDVADMANVRDGDVLLDGGLILKAAPTVNLALVGYNLLGDDDGNFPRAIGTGAALQIMPQLMIAADARWSLAAAADDQATGRYGGGVEYFVTSAGGQAGYPLRLGYIYDAANEGSYLGGGLGYVTPRVALDVGARKQVGGEGDELMIQLGLRLFLPN